VTTKGESRHAWARRFRRQALRIFMLLVIIAAATFVLNFFLSFDNYMPTLNEPKDFDRELLLEKREK
jgi:hypothetical protein